MFCVSVEISKPRPADGPSVRERVDVVNDRDIGYGEVLYTGGGLSNWTNIDWSKTWVFA
jgi:hypothetical protein